MGNNSSRCALGRRPQSNFVTGGHNAHGQRFCPFAEPVPRAKQSSTSRMYPALAPDEEKLREIVLEGPTTSAVRTRVLSSVPARRPPSAFLRFSPGKGRREPGRDARTGVAAGAVFNEEAFQRLAAARREQDHALVDAVEIVSPIVRHGFRLSECALRSRLPVQLGEQIELMDFFLPRAAALGLRLCRKGARARSATGSRRAVSPDFNETGASLPGARRGPGRFCGRRRIPRTKPPALTFFVPPRILVLLIDSSALSSLPAVPVVDRRSASRATWR